MSSPLPATDRAVAGEGMGPTLVFIMGAARSGSTLLGTFLDQDPRVFYAGELSDWALLDGVSTSPAARPLWERIRRRVGPIPVEAAGFKPVLDHSAGLRHGPASERLTAAYRELTSSLFGAIAEETGASVVIDSSHYPRRARRLRRILPGTRLVFAVRRPSSVVRSFRKSGHKSELGVQAYLFVTGVLSWIVYLTHPRSRRAIIAHEAFVSAPHSVGSEALGSAVRGADTRRMTRPSVLIANRFVKEEGTVAIRPPAQRPYRLSDLATDLVQLPLTFAWLLGRGWGPTRGA